MTFDEVIDVAGKGVDVAGVATIVVGALAAAVLTLSRGQPDRYRAFRQRLGRAILLGLELLVAADIIRTVAVMPELADVAALAGIIFIRTFLSFSLELELSGRWPWQHDRPPKGQKAAAA